MRRNKICDLVFFKSVIHVQSKRASHAPKNVAVPRPVAKTIFGIATTAGKNGNCPTIAVVFLALYFSVIECRLSNRENENNDEL